MNYTLDDIFLIAKIHNCYTQYHLDIQNEYSMFMCVLMYIRRIAIYQ